jgi:hypothetical protein
MFPKGNNDTQHLSVYLDVANSRELPSNWSCHATFKLVIKSHFDNKHDDIKYANHTFNAQESDWGFTQFMPLSDLHDQAKGFMVNDQVVVHASISVRKPEGHRRDDVQPREVRTTPGKENTRKRQLFYFNLFSAGGEQRITTEEAWWAPIK